MWYHKRHHLTTAHHMPRLRLSNPGHFRQQIPPLYMGEFFNTMARWFSRFHRRAHHVIPGIVHSICMDALLQFPHRKGQKSDTGHQGLSNDSTYGAKDHVLRVAGPSAYCSASYSAFSRPSATRIASASSRSSSCSSSRAGHRRSRCPISASFWKQLKDHRGVNVRSTIRRTAACAVLFCPPRKIYRKTINIICLFFEN